MNNIFELENENAAPVYDNTSSLMPQEPWLDALNPEQKEAVTTTEGPLLVLSGAGTGKTSVLTTRLAYILAHHLANPWNCLVVTFTNRAAKEMTERAKNMIGDAVNSVWMGTFHGICVKILRQNAELAGLKSNFTILGEDDQKRVIKQISQEMGLDDKKYPPQTLLEKIQLWKDKGLTADKLNPDFHGNTLTNIYKLYQQRLTELNCVDFGDILLLSLKILMSYPDIAEKYQDRFRYIMVDEYQDTNVTQYLLLRLLSQKHRNICCVGDDDQSIYSWRGAEIENILRFEKDFTNSKIIRLERNYRSTANILAAASSLISHNQGRLGKNLVVAENSPANSKENNKIKIVSTYSGSDEAAYIASEIDNLHRSGLPYSEIAVLVRTAAQTREFEEKFIAEALPYQVIGGPKFYERAEIRDILAYLRVIVQPSDDLALERIINKPSRGIGAKTIEKLHTLSKENQISMYGAIKKSMEENIFSGKTKESLSNLMQNFKTWQENSFVLSPDEIVLQVIEDSGYMEMLQNEKTPEAEGRIENLKELVNVMSDHDLYPTLSEFLEHVSLVMENDSTIDRNKVTLMTLHSAKGLEFDAVFLPGWEEGLFPHQRSLDNEQSGDLEEERRLAYVAITRAKQMVYISVAMNRRIYGQWQSNIPSRFINEIPPQNIEICNYSATFGAPYKKQQNYNKTSYYNNNLNNNINQEDDRFSYEPIDDYAYSYPYPKRKNSSQFATGARVFHSSFGYGKVIGAENNSVEVWFDKYGRKKILQDYIKKV